MVRRGSLALAVNPFCDGVTVKILVGGNLKTYPKPLGKNISWQSCKNSINRTRRYGEGVAHDRCSLDQQWRHGRHPFTARMKWNKQINNVGI